mgnify:CR=1 FL=1
MALGGIVRGTQFQRHLMFRAQVERLLVTAIEACERYFQAFQFVVWAGKTAAERAERLRDQRVVRVGGLT